MYYQKNVGRMVGWISVLARVIHRVFSRLNTRILLLCFFIPSAIAAEQSIELTNLLNQLTTLQGAFTQIQYSKQSQQEINSSGTFAIQRPDHFRWETMQPSTQLIIANGKKIWLYESDLQQVTEYNQQKDMNDTPAVILSGKAQALKDRYRVYSLSQVANIVPAICKNKLNTNIPSKFCLIPKEKQSSLQAILMGFDHLKPVEMWIKDQLGQTTRISYQNVQVNKTIPSSRFNFRVPPNVEVIKDQN